MTISQNSAGLAWLRCTFAPFGPRLGRHPDLNHHRLCDRRAQQILGKRVVLLSIVSKQIGLKEQELWAAKSWLGKLLKEEKTYSYQYDLLHPDIHWHVNAEGNNFKLYRFLNFQVKLPVILEHREGVFKCPISCSLIKVLLRWRNISPCFRLHKSLCAGVSDLGKLTSDRTCSSFITCCNMCLSLSAISLLWSSTSSSKYACGTRR